MICLTIPTTSADRTLVIEMACDYTEEYLNGQGTLPPSSLLTTETLTLIIRRNSRPIGALSMATGDDEDKNERSEIDTIYLIPKYRGKGYAAAAVHEFSSASPHPAFIRGPLDPAMAHIAEALEIPTEDVHDMCSLNTVTRAFLNTVPCEHRMEPCRNCIHTEMRGHFTKTYDLLSSSLEGAIA